jgi:glycosyltransferase involved in cell wall biosynthesis
MLVYRLATAFFTNSKESKKDLQKTFGISHRKITVLPLLKKSPSQKFTSNKSTNSYPYISFIGRLDYSKDQFTAIRALSIVNETHPEVKIKFAGDGPIKHELEDYAKHYGVERNCEFLGNIRQDQVYELLGSSKINLCISKAEAFGLVNVEALSMGVPIIGTFVGGIKEIIEDGRNGFFISVGSAKELSDKVENILNSPTLYTNLCYNAKQTFDNYYNVDKNINFQTNLILEKIS